MHGCLLLRRQYFRLVSSLFCYVYFFNIMFFVIPLVLFLLLLLFLCVICEVIQSNWGDTFIQQWQTVLLLFKLQYQANSKRFPGIKATNSKKTPEKLMFNQNNTQWCQVLAHNRTTATTTSTTIKTKASKRYESVECFLPPIQIKPFLSSPARASLNSCFHWNAVSSRISCFSTALICYARSFV